MKEAVKSEISVFCQKIIKQLIDAKITKESPVYLDIQNMIHTFLFLIFTLTHLIQSKI
jgi:hypothetical protein